MNHEASMQDMCKDMNSVSCNFVFTFPKLRGSEASKYVEESIKYILRPWFQCMTRVMV